MELNTVFSFLLSGRFATAQAREMKSYGVMSDNLSTRVIDIEEIEDYGMSILVKDVDRTKKVSREIVMKKLKFR